MLKTNPPPPPITNLRFQSSGISSVNLISLPITPFTRQCGTRTCPVVAAGTGAASVIFTSGSCSVVRLAHSAGLATAAGAAVRTGTGAASAMETATATPARSRVWLVMGA